MKKNKILSLLTLGLIMLSSCTPDPIQIQGHIDINETVKDKAEQTFFVFNITYLSRLDNTLKLKIENLNNKKTGIRHHEKLITSVSIDGKYLETRNIPGVFNYGSYYPLDENKTVYEIVIVFKTLQSDTLAYNTTSYLSFVDEPFTLFDFWTI